MIVPQCLNRLWKLYSSHVNFSDRTTLTISGVSTATIHTQILLSILPLKHVCSTAFHVSYNINVPLPQKISTNLNFNSETCQCRGSQHSGPQPRAHHIYPIIIAIIWISTLTFFSTANIKWPCIPLITPFLIFFRWVVKATNFLYISYQIHCCFKLLTHTR